MANDQARSVAAREYMQAILSDPPISEQDLDKYEAAAAEANIQAFQNEGVLENF